MFKTTVMLLILNFQADSICLHAIIPLACIRVVTYSFICFPFEILKCDFFTLICGIPIPIKTYQTPLM